MGSKKEVFSLNQ